MKYFKYKIGLGVKVFSIVIIAIWLAATIFSILKLCGKTIFVSISNTIDILTIVFAVVCIALLISINFLRYAVTPKGIQLKIGTINISGKKYDYKNVSAIVYKVKTQKLLICSDITAEQPKGTAININAESFNSFVDAVKNCGVAFDYIEDIS